MDSRTLCRCECNDMYNNNDGMLIESPLCDRLMHRKSQRHINAESAHEIRQPHEEPIDRFAPILPVILCDEEDVNKGRGGLINEQ
jgi:hypothetical protein